VKIHALVIAVVCTAVLAGCGSGRSPSGVPSLAGGTAQPGATGSGRVAALHAAAECIRQHGAPTYQDPVLSADGHVYTDARSLQNLDNGNRDTPKLDALRQACGSLVAAAGFQPADEAPAPPKLVQAGVALARCLRANGMPNYRDPTSSSPFTPGHGFGITADEMPNGGAGGKADPTFQHALAACHTLNDAEIQASTLGNLAHD
jgi:hypothetical protein